MLLNYVELLSCSGHWDFCATFVLVWIRLGIDKKITGVFGWWVGLGMRGMGMGGTEWYSKGCGCGGNDFPIRWERGSHSIQ